MTYVSKLSMPNGVRVSSTYFLGDVPDQIILAANSCHSDPIDVRIPVWNQHNARTLEKYYGKNWKEILTPSDPIESQSSGLFSPSSHNTIKRTSKRNKWQSSRY